MNQLIGLLLPNIIGVKRLDKLYGEEKSIRKILERYLKCILFTNLVSYAITIYIFKQPEFVFTNQFTLKYVILSLVVTYILPIIFKFVTENVNVNIKVEKNEEKD